MYSVVINPPLPTLVIDRPYCCSVEATVSAIPQESPPMMVVFSGSGLRSAFGTLPRMISITGISTALPIRFLAPLNVSGPIESIPAFCETNAMPQTIAAVSSNRQFLIFFAFVMT